jgi:hypothetical protein
VARATRTGLVCGALLAWPASTLAQGAETALATPVDHDAADPNPETTSDRSASPLSLGPLHLALFVDAYATWQTSGKGTRATLSDHRAFSGQGATLRAENGFSLAFLGLDAQYDAGDFGVVANLRFGPAATIFHGKSDLQFGVDHLTQAYALYRPLAELQLDLGMFISPFGVEALESWKNPNYTISALYMYGQPNWHMGLRATWQLNDELSLMALVVNGTNNISETQQNGGLDQTPTVGGNVSWQVHPALSCTLGGLVAVDGAHNDDEGIDGFVDFISVLELGPLSTLVNLDWIFTRDGAPNGQNRYFWGGSLTQRYRFNDVLAVAARVEYLHDDASYDDTGDVWRLVTGTFTLDVRPVRHRSYLIVRWEQRWESSNQRIFGDDNRGTTDLADDSYRRTWFESVLGVVVTTDP